MEYSKMLFTIPPALHAPDQVRKILNEHAEVKFVSFVGVDLGGHDTDEKIPVALFLKDMEQFFQQGVQTDGSSVVLPKIAALNNAKVDIVPDPDVNWYVDYNFQNVIQESGLPVGTLRIPAFLVHNDTAEVGSRSMLRQTVQYFKEQIMELLRTYPYALSYMGIDSADEIDSVLLTGATELEFWVKTPDDKADREQLSTSQELKEQYWQRTRGNVRTALERTLTFLDAYGLGVEMGHKEVGGIKAKLGHSGQYDHIMEQLEIDWKYSTVLQSADNETHVRYVVKDIFRMYGLDVTFMAKPIEGVAGSGKHTHMGVMVKKKDGTVVNLFAPADWKAHFMTPVGFGALLGILKNYEVMEPFIACTNDALDRLQPGFEAPVCVVTSLGLSTEQPSRNRTVLVGLVRDEKNPLSTRFELRSPCPKNNTYLVMAAAYLAMLDGIRTVLEKGKTPEELVKSLSKEWGQEDFYLETDRAYRSEEDVYQAYNEEQRNRMFGKAPSTVWESLSRLKRYPEKTAVLREGNVFDDKTLDSYEEAILAQWAMELHNRIIPNTMDLIRDCRKRHNDAESTDFDLLNWSKVQELRVYLGQDKIAKKCLLTRIKKALDEKDYQTASNLQKEMQASVKELVRMYSEYRKNLF